MKLFTKTLIGDPASMPAPGDVSAWPEGSRIWPKNPGMPKDQIRDEYAIFVYQLMTFGFFNGPPSLNPQPTTEPGKSIWQFLTNQGWPNSSPVVPGHSKTTVALVEIAVILDRLLQALNTYEAAGSSSTGGGPSVWPPH
jgi:hypothetical protein